MNSQTSKNLDDAAAWVARMDGMAWTDRDEAELQAWLGGDPLRQGALLQCQAAWSSLDRPRTQAASPRRSVRRTWLAASGLLAASLAAVSVYLAQAPDAYQTQVGEIRRVPLADGSVAAVNTASRLEFKVVDGRREANLQRGEAWFQVAKDPRHPFVVEAGRVRVQAVGTAFSVRRSAEGAEVLVNEGVVEAWAAGAEGHRIRIGAGQRAFVTDDAAITKVAASPSSIDRALAWRAGRIDLSNDQLGSAVAEFNRYNRAQIVLADPSLAEERFDGVFRIDDPAGFAAAIGLSLGQTVDQSDPKTIRIGQAAH
ncbi:MAG: FecR domain-containing protein [Alphaproteobacteria bacterium]|nr:FecR domain-containing protein [Alphaproteobacteria bacterium]MBU1516628.1 FecR domain-containing protein [Alphaproteobacteria bacterium]MBU2094384.1 FecR domain-containing protein [Alphaproteobacteria bacterium]MBU2153269.1 FecR domain-containing protein [Alphaproteobacteria bacterium]MBU2307555.1 FecR domain-containing protein [Alphaproteobacteria bacterium]